MGVTPPYINVQMALAEVRKRPKTVPGGQNPFQTCKNRIFRTKISEIFRTRPDASERLQMHPDASGPVRTGPNRSEQVRTGPNKSENFEKRTKTSKN